MANLEPEGTVVYLRRTGSATTLYDLIRYTGKPPPEPTPPRAEPVLPHRRHKRNDRCPCNSGKKFKHCCRH